MIKNVYDLLRILLKQKSKSHVKRQKSKLLVYDIYLKKYVSADKLLVRSPAKDSIEGLDSLKKSKDFMLFDLLLKKFINPKLDLLSPPGVNIKSKIWHCNTVQGCRYASTLKDFWGRGSGNNTGQVPALPSTSKVGNEHVVGWAGQVISKPDSNPRPEHSTSPTTEPSGNPEKNSRTPSSTPGKVKSKRYDKSSARNGALLYEGKSERKKKSILGKSLKLQKDVTLQTNSKSKLWAKKYNIFNKSINAMKPKPESKEELFRVKPPKREKETLFNKICSQMFSLRTTGGTDREDNLSKGSNLQKKDNISKDAKTPSQTKNSYNKKSVFENDTSDSKLAKINKEYQKVSQNKNSSKSETSVVENNILDNKLAKNVKENHKVTQNVTSSQDEKTYVKNQTSESKLKTNLKEHNKVTHNLTRTKTETYVDKNNNTLENKLAKHVKEHHKVTHSLKSFQDKKPVKNKILESALATNVKEHHIVTQNLSNSENEKTAGLSKTDLVKSVKDQKVAQSFSSSKSETFSEKNNTLEGVMAKSVKENLKVTQNVSSSENEKAGSISKINLAKSVKDHQQVAHNLSRSKSEIFYIKTSEEKLANGLKEHYKVTKNLKSSENEKPDVKNKISESIEPTNLIELNQITPNFSSSKSETFAVKNNTSEGKMAKSVKEHHTVTQNSSNYQNEKTGGIVKSNLVKSVKDHQKVPNNLSSSESGIFAVNTSEGKLANSVNEHHKVTQNLTSIEDEKRDIKNKLSESIEPTNVKELHQITHNLSSSKSETFAVKNNTSEGKMAKSVKEHHKVTQMLSNSDNEKPRGIVKSNLAKSVKDHQSVAHSLSRSESGIFAVDTSEGNLANSVNEHRKVTQNLTSSENKTTGIQNNTSGNKLADSVKESDKVTHDLIHSQNTEITNKNANDASVNSNQIEAEISEVIQDTVGNLKNESPPQKLKKENLNVIETSKNELRQISSNNINTNDIYLKNNKVDTEKTDIKFVSNNEKSNSEENFNTLANNTSQLENNSGEKYLANQNENMSQEKYQTSKLKSLESVLFNFMCPPTPLKYKQAIYSTGNKINSGGQYENHTLDQTLTKITKNEKSKKVSSVSNLNTTNKVSSLIENTEATAQRGNFPNVNISEKTNPSANPLKQFKNQSDASRLGAFNKPIRSSSYNSKDQNKTQNTTLQTLQKGNIGNTVISGFEKPTVDTKASSLSQKKMFTKVEDDKNDVNAINHHNIEPKCTEKLHAISAQGKCLENLALDGELNQYNIANYKGFKIVNSDTRVTKKNLLEQSKLKEGVERSIILSKSVDKTSGKPADLQKSTESKNSDLHESKKVATKKNLLEQSTPVGGRSSQSKYTGKTLGKPTALQKSTELKNSALHEHKKQVTNNKVILQNKTFLEEKSKYVSSTRHILEVKNIKDQETIKNNIPSNKNMVVENTKVTKEINKHQLPIKNTMVKSVVKTKSVIEQNKPHIRRPTSKAYKGDKNTEESPMVLLSVNKKRNNYIKENTFDHRVRLRRKLMKPIMFNYSIKKSRKFKNTLQQKESKNIYDRKKKESISPKLQSEKLQMQAKSGKKTKYLSKTSQLVSKTQLNKPQRSKSVPVFSEKKTPLVFIRKQGNEKHIMKSKSVETLLSSKKVSSGKQSKSLRQGTQVQSSKLKRPLSEVRYSSKHKSKFSNRPLNTQIKKQSFQSLERINLKAQDVVRMGKITTKRSLQNVNPSKFNETPEKSNSHKGLDSLKIKKRSTIHSQVSHLSKRTVAPKVSKMAVGTNSSPELSNQIEESKNRKGKQFDVKSAKNFKISKPSRAFKNRKEDLNYKNSSQSLKLIKRNQPVNSTENHTNENISREDGKDNKPTIKTKQSIKHISLKNINYNKKSELKKIVSLNKVASNEIKDMIISKYNKNSNNSNEAESFSVKELPQNILNKNESKPGKQEKKIERAETVASITQKAPKIPASPSGSKHRDRSNLNSRSLIDRSREHKKEILKAKNEKVNINNKDVLSDSSSLLPKIKNDVAKQSIALEKYLKKNVRSQETNTKIENKALEDGNTANINFSQLDKARFKSDKLSGKLDNEKVVYNIKNSKNDKINKYKENKQIIVETKELHQITTNTHDESQQVVKDPVYKTEGPRKQHEVAVSHTSNVSNNKEQLSKNGSKTTMLCSTQQNGTIPKTPNKQQPNNEGNKTKAQYGSTKQTVNNPKTFNKKPVSERKTNKLLNSTNQSENSIQTNNNVKNNEGNLEDILKVTKQIINITKEAKKEPSSGKNAPKVLNNMNQNSNTPKAVNKNSDNVTSNKTLATQKFNSKTVNCSHSGNEDTNESSFIKHDSMEKKLKVEDKSSEVKNKKSPHTISEGKMVTLIDIYNKDKDVTTPQQKIGTENSELENHLISRNKINLKLKENSSNKFNTKTEPLTKLRSKTLPQICKRNDEDSLKNKQPLVQGSTIPTNIPDNETHFPAGIKSKVRSISKKDSHTNKEVISNNLKEEESTKKYIGNNDRNPLSSLHSEVKHNVKISSPNKNISKTKSKGNDAAISRKRVENSNINKSSLIKDKAFDVSPDMRRKLSSAKLNIQETKLSSSKSDYDFERQKRPPHDRTIEGKSIKEKNVKQQDIKGKQDQYLQDVVQIVGFKNDTTRNGIAMDNTNNGVKTVETEHNVSLGAKKTVCETKKDSCEINESHFKTKDHTREKLRLMLGNIKTVSDQKYINDNKEPIKQFSEIGKEENKVITPHKVQIGNKKEAKKPEPTTFNLKHIQNNSNEQFLSTKKSEQDLRLIQLSKNCSSLKTKELNDDVIKLNENIKIGPAGQNTTEKEVLKNNSNVKSIKNTDSIPIDTKINTTTQNDLLNLMDKNQIKTTIRNEKADIKSTNKGQNTEVKSTKCDTSQVNRKQSLKAPFVEDTNTPNKKGKTSLVSFKNNKTSE